MKNVANKSLWIHFDGNRSGLIFPGLHQGEHSSSPWVVKAVGHPLRLTLSTLHELCFFYKITILLKKSSTTTE